MRFILFITFIWISTTGCKHSLPGEENPPVPTRLNVDIVCQGCPTAPICPVTDDIPVNAQTTYSVCVPSPAGQGSFETDANHCLIWTPSTNATEVVKTCIVACTGGVCDTTYITLFPPGSSGGIPCNPDTVYFENDILPILLTRCAFSGCHNQASASDGVVLDSYTKIIQTGKVKPGNPGGSDLYEAIKETKPDKIMPPPPAQPLSVAQIAMIEKWIRQGAKNNRCNQSECDTVNVSYNVFVKPTLAGCTTCHNATSAGGGVRLDTYSGVKSVAANGKLYGSISWSTGYINMPLGGARMDACKIKKIKSWIDAGSPEN